MHMNFKSLFDGVDGINDHVDTIHDYLDEVVDNPVVDTLSNREEAKDRMTSFNEAFRKFKSEANSFKEFLKNQGNPIKLDSELKEILKTKFIFVNPEESNMIQMTLDLDEKLCSRVYSCDSFLMNACDYSLDGNPSYIDKLYAYINCKGAEKIYVIGGYCCFGASSLDEVVTRLCSIHTAIGKIIAFLNEPGDSPQRWLFSGKKDLEKWLLTT